MDLEVPRSSRGGGTILVFPVENPGRRERAMLARDGAIMRTLLALAALAALSALPATAQTQEPGGASAQNEAASSPATCGPRAALYQAGKGPKVWVIRRGTMVLAENPLRPLSADEAVVLDVVVNGRRATAHGPDLDHLRQGGTPKAVEREGREPIRWADDGPAAPSIRVIAEDGRVLLGPMAFAGCEDAPGAKPVVDAPVKAEAPAKGRRRGKEAATGDDPMMPAHLPQGALPGLSLPKR